jgi:ubiquinone/menaquinone biosynthesis C-methylase UbiE
LTIPRLALALLLLAAAAGPTAAQPPQPQAQSGRHTLFSPTDLSLLESPDRDIWQKPDQIMDALGIADGSKVADIGAGAGYFTVRLARRVGPNGVVWANDAQDAMIEAIKRRVAKDVSKDIRSAVKTVQGTPSDPKLPAGSLDAVLMVETFSEIQPGNIVPFLRNIRAALRDGGRVGIIDYKNDGGGPGPDDDRPAPGTVMAAAQEAGLRLLKEETFLPFQFFLVFTK